MNNSWLIDNWKRWVEEPEPTSQELITELHEAYGHPINVPLDQAGLRLAITLIEEEYRELMEELWNTLQTGKISPNLLKEHADLRVVLSGLAVRLGYDEEECVRRVHESNMSKLGEDGQPIHREDGKVLKGPNYAPPDLSDLVPYNCPHCEKYISINECGCV